MADWLYAIECVAVPCAIGGVMFALFNVLDRWHRRVRKGDGLPPIDYSI